jgi:hypothetical protein
MDDSGSDPNDPDTAPCDFGDLDQFLDCATSVSSASSLGVAGGNSGGFQWPQGVSAIWFRPYMNPATPVVWTKDKVFDANGNFIIPPVSFGTGLQTVRLDMANGRSRTVFFDQQTAFTYQLMQKDFLSVTAFPDPITDNSFNLRLKASATLSFTYVLMDDKGNTLLKKNYLLTKDQDLTDLIEERPSIPTGLLFNKMTFSDGSEINFKTYK